MNAPSRALVVWDLHGVLVTGGSADQAAFARRVGLDVTVWDRIRHRLLGDEAAWDRVETGRLALDDFASDLAGRVNGEGGRCTPADARGIWGAPHPFHESVAAADVLAAVARYPAPVEHAIGTNNVAEWRAVWGALVEVEAFDWVFDSSAIGHRKPDAGFWEHVERATGVPGDHVLLVDDNALNVEAARRHGWSGVLFAEPARALAEVETWVSRHVRPDHAPTGRG